MVSNMDFTGVDIQTITEEQLPSMVRSQCEILSELDQKLEVAMQKAQIAIQSANRAAEVKTGPLSALFGGGKRKAIRANQQGAIDLANANEANTEAIKVAAEQQKRITQIMRWFLALGTTSLAMNRATVQQLKILFKQGTFDHLSEATRDELKGVIRDLKAQEDFMQKQARTEQAVKQHEKKFKKLERSQKCLFGIVSITLLLLAVLGVSVVGSKNFMPDNTNIVDVPSMPSVPSETNETPDSIENIAPEISEESEGQIQTQQSAETGDIHQTGENYIEENPHSLPTDAQNEDNPILPEESIAPITSEADTIDLNALEGTWGLRSNTNTYVNIFESSNKYYITFVVTNGGFAHYLPQPAELIADGEYAVASYDVDNEGNYGTIKITFSNNGEPLITATMNDSSTPVYSSSDELLYLIISDIPMYSNPDMKDYPVYKEYLDPALFGDL